MRKVIRCFIFFPDVVTPSLNQGSSIQETLLFKPPCLNRAEQNTEELGCKFCTSKSQMEVLHPSEIEKYENFGAIEILVTNDSLGFILSIISATFTSQYCSDLHHPFIEKKLCHLEVVDSC